MDEYRKLRVPIFAWDEAASVTILARTALQELWSVYFLLPGSLVGVAKGLLEASSKGRALRAGVLSLGENALRLDCVFCLPGSSVWIAILVSLVPLTLRKPVQFCASLVLCTAVLTAGPMAVCFLASRDEINFGKPSYWPGVLLIFLMCEVPETCNYFHRIKDGKG